MLRRWWLIAVIGVAASLLGCGAAGVAAWRASSKGWIEIATPHFVIQTDVAKSRALEMAQALEDSRAALLEAAWPGAAPPRGRTRVILFERQRDLSRYAGRSNQGIVLTRPGFERLLAFTDVGDEPTVAVHELVHDLSRWFLPLQPLWLAEGLALYLESIEIERGEVMTGSVSRERAAWLRRAKFRPSTSQLFASLDSDSGDPRDTASFYLGCWALVHYLLDEQPQAFGRFQEALGRLTPWRTAWDQSFPGLTNAELDRELAAYLKEGRFERARSRFTPAIFEPGVRALSPAEVHGARALLANTSGQAIDDTEVAAALDLDPNELDALTVRFHALGAAARGPRADIATRAVMAHPERAGAWLLLALSASERDGRQRALARAERLDPDHPGVVGLLAEDALARNDPGAALIHVRHAQRSSGVTPRNLALLFAALAASNRCGEAAAVRERADLVFESECRVSPGAGRFSRGTPSGLGGQ